MVEHGRDHGRGSGLAVRARHGNGQRPPRERPQHLGTGPDGNVELPSTHDLRIVLRNGRRGHDKVGYRLVYGRGSVANIDLDARIHKVTNVARGLEVGTRYPAPTFVEHVCDPTHARTPYTNEVGAREAACVVVCHGHEILSP